ncbi:MAG TPA: hypothetical protein VFV08_12320 [Puia sp.]|nr:hypothetical protein [Puia sp.]
MPACMKISLLSLLIFISAFTLGQKKAFPDLKGDKESFVKLIDSTLRYELASFTIEGQNTIESTSKLIEFNLTKFSSNFSQFELDSFKVRVTMGKFEKSKHKISYLDKYALKIDNKPIYGTDGELPSTQINSITVVIGSDSVTIPKIEYADLFQPSLSRKEGKETVGRLHVYASKDRQRIYIYMENSESAGAYEATFIIQDKKYSRRVIDYGY